MEDSGIPSNTEDILSKMRRERINWVNGNRSRLDNSEPLDSVTDSMKAEVNNALSETASRMENIRKVIAEAQNERIEQDLRRVTEDIVEIPTRYQRCKKNMYLHPLLALQIIMNILLVNFSTILRLIIF